MNMHWALYRDILPRLQDTKIRGCHFCLPSALILPCNHSMWSVLSGFSPRSETKVSALRPPQLLPLSRCQHLPVPCPSFPLLQKKPQIYLSLYVFLCLPSESSTSYFKKQCGCVHVHVQEKWSFSQWVSPPSPPKRGGVWREKEGETLSPLEHSRVVGCHQLLVIPHSTVPLSVPQITSPTTSLPHFRESKASRQRCDHCVGSHW